MVPPWPPSKGSPPSNLALGSSAPTARGYRRTSRQAVKWYRRDDEQGDADAQLDLAFMYARGKGVLKDRVKAYAWYILAADPGK